MNRENITIGQALEAFQRIAEEFAVSEVATSEDIELVNEAVQVDLNFRDLFMGLPKHIDINTCIEIVSYFLALVDDKDKVPYYTILSAYVFELGDTDQANSLVDEALTRNENYGLASLLKRVYASMPSSMFTPMRNQLDDKVRATADEMREIKLSELVDA